MKMLIGELAKNVRVSTDTLRHYERKGVIPSPTRSNKGYRLYSTESVERVRLVRRALAVGFTLDELADILSERENGGIPCQRVFKLAFDKLRNLEESILEMQKLREELQNLVLTWEKRLNSNDSTEKPALLLEILPDSANSEIVSDSTIIRNNLRRKSEKTK